MKNQNHAKTLIFTALFVFIIFIIFSYIVSVNILNEFDLYTTIFLQQLLPNYFDWPFSAFSFFGSAEITGLIWLSIIGYYAYIRNKIIALSLLLLPIASLIEIFGKSLIYHPGPAHSFYRGVIHLNLPSQFTPVPYSYPSGHLLRTTFLITFLILLVIFRNKKNEKLTYIPMLLILLIIMTISRIYLGEHWTTDVIGGIFLGFSLGLLSAGSLFYSKQISLPILQESSKQVQE